MIFPLVRENSPLQLWGDVLNSLSFGPGKAVIAANVCHLQDISVSLGVMIAIQPHIRNL